MVTDGDAGRLLTAVLEGVEPEVRELGHLFAGRPDAEDAAGVLRGPVVWIGLVREQTVTARHGPECTARVRPPVRQGRP